MIEACPKTRLHPIGKCPECNANLFEEAQEKGDYHPDHEFIYYELYAVCESCDYYRFIYE